jgi:hypothetical protein
MEEQIEKGFFEFIDAADAEKVHSQTIGWMFSENCKAFSYTNKYLILNELIGKNAEVQVTPETKVYVEINDIDIMIEGEDWIIVIENKIKSSQHSNQLFKYEFLTKYDDKEALPCFLKWKSINFNDSPDKAFENLNLEEKKHFQDTKRLNQKNKKVFYCYLTLTKEKPESSIWDNKTYSDLYKILDKFIKPDESAKDTLIVNEYLKSIKNLTNALDYMVNDEDVRKWVFEHGDYTKQKVYEDEHFKNYSPKIKYIASTGLVRFMQKYYYTKFCEIFGDLNSIINWNGINLRCKVGSSASNGSGLAQIYFPDSTFKFGTHEFVFGYQISGNTIKFNCAAIDYQKSNYNQLPPGIEDKFKDTLDNLKNNPSCFSKLQRKVNDSAKEKGKAYISLTKNYNKKAKKLIEMTPRELFQFIDNELPILHNYAIKIKKSYD